MKRVGRPVASVLRKGRPKMEDAGDLRQVQKELELIRLQLQIIVELLTEIAASTKK